MLSTFLFLGAHNISWANGQSPAELINHKTVTFPAQRSKAARAHSPLLSCVFIIFGGKMNPGGKQQLQLTLKGSVRSTWVAATKRAEGKLASIAVASHSFHMCNNQVASRTRLQGRCRNDPSDWKFQFTLNTFNVKALCLAFIQCAKRAL